MKRCARLQNLMQPMPPDSPSLATYHIAGSLVHTASAPLSTAQQVRQPSQQQLLQEQYRYELDRGIRFDSCEDLCLKGMSTSNSQHAATQLKDGPPKNCFKSDRFRRCTSAQGRRNLLETKPTELVSPVPRQSCGYAKVYMACKELIDPTEQKQANSRRNAEQPRSPQRTRHSKTHGNDLESAQSGELKAAQQRAYDLHEELKAAQQEADELRRQLTKQREDFQQQIAELEQERDNVLHAMMEEGRELQSRIAALVKEKETLSTLSDSRRVEAHLLAALRDAKPAGAPDDGSTSCGGGGTPSSGTTCCGTPRSISSGCIMDAL